MIERYVRELPPSIPRNGCGVEIGGGTRLYAYWS